MDFHTLDKAAEAMSKVSDKIDIYRRIILRGKIDPNFRKTIDLARLSEIENSLNKDVPLYITSLRIAILGYKSDLVGPWDPYNTTKGLPGSEECIVYASEELARRGYKVDLYINPPKDSIWKSVFSNPRWFDEDKWNDEKNKQTYDLVLMWRRFDVDVGRKRGKKVFFWPHDSPPILPPNCQFPPFPNFDGVLLLSEHHKRQFSKWTGFDTIPYIISGNGIVPEQFLNPMKFTNPYSIGYFSNYSRGLAILLLIWPDIKKEFPGATLDICYGREHWGTMSPMQLDWIVRRIESCKELGVTEHGKIGHIPLANMMQSISVLAYPCICIGETYCITVVKAQASGCIPVTTRIAALNETVHPDAPCIQLISSQSDINLYKEILLKTLRRIRDEDSDKIEEERNKYIGFAQKHSWLACVNKWIELYNQIK